MAISYPSHDFSPELLPIHNRPPVSKSKHGNSSDCEGLMVETTRYGKDLDLVVVRVRSRLSANRIVLFMNGKKCQITYLG